MTDRIVVLLDMDCFYCQVEAKEDPSLVGVPSAVVQHNDWRGGGIIAVNYEARAFGVTRNMRGADAKEKCPEIKLIRVPMIREKADLSKYREAGKSVISAIAQFNSKFIVERASVDEAYLDITSAVEALEANLISSQTLPNTNVVGFEKNELQKWLDDLNADDTRLAIGAYIMEQVREVVFEKTGFRCSAGIAHNKILAKISCGLHKPNQQTVLPHSSVPILYGNLKLTKLRGLGGKFGDQVLSLLNIQTAKELSMIHLKTLHKYFDEKTSLWLHKLGQGLDDEPVTGRELPKSIGCSKNFRGPQNKLDTMEKVGRWMKMLAEELSDRLVKDKEAYARVAKTLNIHVGLEGSNGSVSRGGAFSTYDIDGITERGLQLIQKLNSAADKEKYWKPPITLLSLNASKFEEYNGNGTTRISAFFNSKVREQTLQSEPTCTEILKQKENVPETERPLNNECESVESFDTNSDYTNVDPSVLEILPADIKQEIESEIKRRKSDTENETCSKCGVSISPFDLPEHLDFHMAKELQKNYQCVVQSIPSSKRKSSDSNSKESKKQKNILSFFNKI